MVKRRLAHFIEAKSIDHAATYGYAKVLAQRFWMLNHARAFYVAVLDAADTLTKTMRAKLHKNALRKSVGSAFVSGLQHFTSKSPLFYRWVQEMDRAALSGNEVAVNCSIFTCSIIFQDSNLCLPPLPLGCCGSTVEMSTRAFSASTCALPRNSSWAWRALGARSVNSRI